MLAGAAVLARMIERQRAAGMARTLRRTYYAAVALDDAELSEGAVRAGLSALRWQLRGAVAAHTGEWLDPGPPSSTPATRLRSGEWVDLGPPSATREDV